MNRRLVDPLDVDPVLGRTPGEAHPASVIPCKAGATKVFPRSATTTPTVVVCPRLRLRATTSVRYPSSRATDCTLARVSGRTSHILPGSSARDTVAGWTPATLATS